MRRVVPVIGIVLVLALGLSGAPAAAAESTSPVGTSAAQVTQGWRARMLEKVNWIRALAGVAPVRLCSTLNRSASEYAVAMARTGHFGHISPDGTDPADRIRGAGYRFAVAGENLGAGQPTVVRVVRALRESPSHLATMTDPRLRHVGFGHAPGGASTYSDYWVQHFGAGGRCT